MVKWDRTKGKPEPVHLLDRVPVHENDEPLVDMRVVCPSVRIVRPTTIPYLRKSVAEMLEEASRRLPEGYHLGATDCWRPFSRQVLIYEFIMKCAQEAYPHRDYRALKRTVNRWVAPIDRPSPPGHCTGAAVDVQLLDPKGEEHDVVSPFNRFVAAPTYTLGLSETAQRNRDLLVETMLSVGFSNCRDEWWHYSYGDAGWAVRLDKPNCVYGLVELEPDLYHEQEALAAESIRSRPNPFLTGRG